MKTAVVVTCGLLDFWALSAQSQEVVCPDPPPPHSRTDERYVEVNASIVSKLLSAVGLGAGRKVTVDDVIAHYRNPDELFLAARQLAWECQAIMASPELDTMEKKRAEMRKVYREIFGDIANLRSQPPLPSRIPDHTLPDPDHSRRGDGISAANAAKMAQAAVLSLHRYGSTTNEVMANLGLPFCSGTKLLKTPRELEGDLEGALAWVDKGLQQSGSEFISTVDEFLTNPGPLPANLTDLPDTIRNCQDGGAISADDYISVVAIQSRGIVRYMYVVVVGRKSGLVQSIITTLALRGP